MSRQVIAPDSNGQFSLYADTPDGLIWFGWWPTLDEALANASDTVRFAPAIWDAPIIDPADPSTYPPDYFEDRGCPMF